MTASEQTADPSGRVMDYITSCCARIGAFKGPTSVHACLKDVASEMAVAEPSAVFPERHIEHVAYAVDMVASHVFTSPPAAIAAVYLATRFEFYFRTISGKLSGDGTWVAPSAQGAARAALKDPRIGGKRISSVGLAYKIMKLDGSLPLVKHCMSLDDTLCSGPTRVVGGISITDIGDRIEFGRHAVGHGHLGDISSEGVFYGLMTALVFYNQG